MLNKIRKQKIGDKEYSFKMTNKTIRKIDEKYGNYGSVIYGLMEGQQFYTNALRLISMCCVNKEKVIINREEDKYKEKIKEWDIEELEDIITGQQYQEIANLAVDLYMDYMGFNEESKKEKKEEVKEEKN
ncbi:RNA polymerase subunit sigma [Clostridium botulinum]|uniref:RNA polymerase subunit sigma n=1 Tax=Clostridium botulinum TaxID=1491 RepID=UPI000C794D98|nr:RNA polymerase subunit sigma [Clostridium botulinum]AUM89754.1 RNA polymerase subunit sigma [Clostridium botulinum]AWB32295.1 RNA polymerase subunit sigma [Clostridium botulinum]MBY6830680.1 RNA polymerase subunit sigma [Clostridium botulinum]MBY6923946.1 RNA polymerase subunit sigma [Clostridium botulinum]MBY6940404.1 RNA polymerase subunit sigma [Clostridium botulinum]